MTNCLLNACKLSALILIVFAVATGNCQARLWSNASGEYTLEAELVMSNEKSVVLKRADHELVAIPLAELSTEDREHLKSQEALDAQKKADERQQTLKLTDGTEIVGRIIDFAERDITLRRWRGNFYVNDRKLDNLPKFYQRLLPQVVAHFETLRTVDLSGLENWMVRQRGRPRTFHLEGVLIESESGDVHAVPFFLLPETERNLWERYWKNWQAASKESTFESREDLAFLLKSFAAARAEDAQVQREIAELQLKMQAVQAGVTSLWEVTLYPDVAMNGWPQWVVVLGRDNRQATITALEQNPGFVAGPVRRVSRR
ncbi:MAG: SHD1 domain-containing protein [Bythopirellula sp.]|nr:SHD1 domain-containing protein [Bythopirellula sp.]